MKKKKDILFLLQFFYPEYISSATLPFDTACELASKGFSVDVLCGYPHEYTEETKIPRKQAVNNIDIKRVKYLQLDRKKSLGRIVNYLSLTIAMFLRFFAMRKYKTIMVYSNPPILPLVAALASKLFKCRLIFVAYDLYPEIALKTNSLTQNSMIAKLMNFINRFVFKQASAVVALSSEMKDYIIQNRNITEDKVYVIHNWYKDEYQLDYIKGNNSFSSVVNNRFVIGYFGNMGIAQDMEPIKQAIRYYKDDSEICFLLSGHGLKYSEIEQMINDEKIENVYLYGFLKGQEYYDALRVSNCAIISLEKNLTGLCVPSKTYGFMMMGIPIVAIMEESDIVRDVESGAGYHILDNSSASLIELIKELKKNLNECRQKGQISRNIYLEKYTPEKSLLKYSQLLKKICEM